MRNASTERRWLQTAGLPLPPDAQAVRDELDGIDRIQITPYSNRIVLFDADGEPIGVLDLNTDPLERVRSKTAKPDQPRQPDPAKGDTVVRALDPNDPLAKSGPRILADDRDPPPIDLPDYTPGDGQADDFWEGGADHRSKVLVWGCIALIGCLAIAGTAAIFNHFWN